jgi:putative ABC transport system permease protein
MNDLRFALRQLLKHPGFTAIAVLTLALGIGANTAIFSVVEAVLLRPLPYPDGEKLVVIWQREGAEDHSNNYLNYLDWQAQSTSFTELSIYRRDSLSLSGDGAPESLTGALASANFFTAAGIPPLLGRTFNAEEDSPGGTRVVVLGHALWQRRFGGDRQVLGRTLILDAIPHTVIGVMPATMGLPRAAELWIPIGPYTTAESWQDRGNNPGLYSLGRIKPGSSVEQARAEMFAISERLGAQYPRELGRTRTVLTPLLDTSVGTYRSGLWTLIGAAALTLAIACANVAGLQLARGVTRTREFAIRAALGSGRRRLIRQLLAESLLLSLLGGLGGVLLASWSLDAIRLLAPANVPRFQQLELNPMVLGFALAVSVASGILFGLWPALRASQPDLRSALQAGGYAGTGGRSVGRARQWLVTAQVSVTVALLTGAGLLLASLGRMQREQLGFDSRGILTFRLALPGGQYDGNPARVSQLFDNLKRDLAALPGVRSVGSNFAPPLRTAWQSGFYVEGQPEPPPAERPSMELGFIDADYFRTVGIPLLRGRTFDDREQAEDPRGIVIDQAFADRHFPGVDPLGKRIVLGDGWSKNPELQKATVLGVVPTLKLYGYAEQPRLVQAYLARRQIGQLETSFLLKADGNLSALVAPIREAVSRLDPNVPISDIRTMEEVVGATFVSARLYSTLLGLFAGLAVLLAVLGLWGVVGYTVAQRRREIGVRLALGANARQVVGLMLREGLKPLLLGLAAGLGASILTGRLLQHLLFRVSPFEPGILAIVALAFLAVASLACWLPARRAAAIDPSEALRSE